MPRANSQITPRQLQFVHERRENVERYRPYRNPQRIALNDKKRRGALAREDIAPQHDEGWNDVLAASSASAPILLSPTDGLAPPATAQAPTVVARSPSFPHSIICVGEQQHPTFTPTVDNNISASPQTPSSTAIHTPSPGTTFSPFQTGHAFHAGPWPNNLPDHQKPTATYPASAAQRRFQNTAGTATSPTPFADFAPRDFLPCPVPLPTNLVPSAVAHWQDELFAQDALVYAHPTVGHAPVPDIRSASLAAGPSFWLPPSLPTTPLPPQAAHSPNFDFAQFIDDDHLFVEELATFPADGA